MIGIIKYFKKALSTDADIIEVTKGNIYPIAITDESLMDKLPYIVVGFKGAGAMDDTKDMRCPKVGNPTVEVIVATETDDELYDLLSMVEKRIREYSNEEYDEDTALDEKLDFWVDKVTPQEGEAYFDDMRPAFACHIIYQCDTQSK